MGKKTTLKHKKLTEAELRERFDFEYIREHFFDLEYDEADITKDIVDIYNDTLDLRQLSAEGKNTVRVTNYFVRETQLKATSIRSKMSPYNAIYDNEALCQILNRILSHPRFFSIYNTTKDKLDSQGYAELMEVDTSTMEDGLRKENIIKAQQEYKDLLNRADLQEVRRALAHIPAYHRVSQFPNHVAQRVYEKYAAVEGGVILDSSAGWGNRMMAAMSSKYHYRYLGTDPNSEMHNNYYALAELMWKTLYKTNALTHEKKFPVDYIDIRDQGSEFDIPEWHNYSGYDKEELKKMSDELTKQNKEKTQHFFEAHGFKHPTNEGKGICDTGELNTTGLNLPPLLNTHDEEIYYSGIGDLSFTSPPYFALECYTESSFKGNLDDGQSAGKGDNYPRWVREFVYPTVINHFNYIKPGGYYTYNLKDLPKDKMYLYSDWLSVCLDVGFELIEQPEMILKARRQFGKKEDGMTDKINFKGATEKIGVLRKPLKHTDYHISPDNEDALYHVQTNFNYPLIKHTRPEGFVSRLPKQIEDYLEENYEGLNYKLIKRKKNK